MNRVVVVGSSGAGKSTLARRLAQQLDVPRVELDALFHQPGWTELPDHEFRVRVTAAVAAPRWVVDGNYRQVRDIIWGRADTVVWIDLPRPLVVWRVVRRTAGRVLVRRELWNGNRERLGNALSWDPERSIIRWSWTQYAATRERIKTYVDDPRNAHLTVHRLRSRSEVRKFMKQAA